MFLVLRMASLPSLCAAQVASLAPVDAPVDASVTGWLSELKAGFEKAYRERVVDAYAAGVAEAKQDYLDQIQLALKEAERAGDKQAAVVFRQESERAAEETWRMPPDDQDTSLETLRRARRVYREKVPELNRAWDEASRKLASEFESALVQGAQRLAGRNLEGEVRRVLACRQELVSVWLPQMWEIHRGDRISLPDGVGEKGAGPMDGYPEMGAPVSRKDLEETVKWVLSGSGRIHVRQNGRVQLLQKVGDLPKGKFEFFSVSLNRERFDRVLKPGEVRRLGQFRSLQQLYLGGFNLAAEDWHFFAGLRQLEILHLSQMRLDTWAAGWMAQCKKLRALELGDCEGLTPEFFRQIAAGVPGLKDLKLTRSRVPDEAGMELGGFERLEGLTVDGTGLTPAVLPAWTGLRALHSLVWSDGDWSREVLEALKRHPIEKMGFLDTSHPDFPAQVALLGELFPKLKALELKGKKLSVPHALAIVENLRNLEGLNLQWVELNVEAAKAVARLPHLRVLICRAPGLGDDVFKELLAIRGLNELDVAGTRVSDQSTEAIHRAGLNGLRVLTLVNTQVSKGAAASLERRVKGLSLRTVPTQIGWIP
jgi:hypothetical protein